MFFKVTSWSRRKPPYPRMCVIYFPCKHLAKSFLLNETSEDSSQFIPSFKDPWMMKLSSQGCCEQNDSFQDYLRLIHSLSGSCKNLTLNLALPRILDGIPIFTRTLKVHLKIMYLLSNSFKDLRRFLQGFRFRKYRIIFRLQNSAEYKSPDFSRQLPSKQLISGYKSHHIIHFFKLTATSKLLNVLLFLFLLN